MQQHLRKRLTHWIADYRLVLPSNGTACEGRPAGLDLGMQLLAIKKKNVAVLASHGWVGGGGGEGG